jgi:hypothetical protein
MLEIVSYNDGAMAEHWDDFCGRSINGTFLHTRRFLSYHGQRLADCSAALLHDGELIGILPAAVAIDASDVVVSHPGATFGGVVHDGWLTGQRMIEAMEAIKRHFAALGFKTLRYKPVPYIYFSCPAEDDGYALFRVGARRVRCDLSSCIDLVQRRPSSARRQRALRKAHANVRIDHDMSMLPEFYAVLVENLASRHGAAPVHQLAELEDLTRRFPAEISLSVAIAQEQVVGGILSFRTPRVVHAQYIASTAAGHECSALDAVFEESIAAAAVEGVRFFDFGISNEDDGRILNEGLYRFKTEFGGGGVILEQFEIDLTARA